MSDPAPSFRLTYSTMFDPPAVMHERFEAALARVRPSLGREHPMFVDGKPRTTPSGFEVRSPIDTDLVIGRFQSGSAADVDAAVSAARHAGRSWSRTPWAERVALLRRAAALIEERVYEISAAMAIEIGKNRMESLGEVQETAELVSWYCDRMEAADGFRRELPNDPLTGFVSRNRTQLRPHGVWAVIAPFNFPFALAGGPIGAALATDRKSVV